jgi:hypothetical protein
MVIVRFLCKLVLLLTLISLLIITVIVAIAVFMGVIMPEFVFVGGREEKVIKLFIR